jgi:chromosome segregation ATPase
MGKLSKLEELDRLERALSDAEIGLKSILLNLEKIDNEIAILVQRKNELTQNIEFHKKEDVVPIAQEYRKSKEELAKIIARLILLNSDRNKSQSAIKTTESIIEKFKRDHMELLKTGDNNVLRPAFGGKRG